MVKARKGNMLFFGLTDVNLERLKQDQPIKFNLTELGMDDIDIVIFTGKDENTIYEMMRQAINPNTTVVKDDKRKEK